jgi:hypothetical protein
VYKQQNLIAARLNNWVECSVANNPSCTFCHLGDPANDPTCNDLKLAYCPFAQCCSECVTEASFYAQCTANDWTDMNQQSACDLNCSSFVPVASNGTNTDCSQAANNWVDCQITNIFSYNLCFLGDPAYDATCNDLKLAYCPLAECCPECATEASFYAQCTANCLTDASQQSACDLGYSGNSQSPSSDAFTNTGIFVSTVVAVVEFVGIFLVFE